jgi:hypothetical protein
MSAPLDAARLVYRGEGLALPEWPEHSMGPLRQLSGSAFATRDVDWTLYDFNRFVGELLTGAPQPYVAFGFAGHGFASQAAHYYAVSERCAVMFQMRWGGVYDDPEAGRRRHNASLRVALKIEQAAADLDRAGRFPAGKRLAVLQSKFHGSRWAWLPKDGTSGFLAPEWRASRDAAMVQALSELYPPLRRAA